MVSHSPIRLAILLSGSGRTLVNLHNHIEAGALPARIVRVVSSRADVLGVERARKRHLPVEIIEKKRFRNADKSAAIAQTKACGATRGVTPSGGALDDASFQDALTRAVGDVDLVCMAGFLSLWRIPDAYTGRVINIHPALLPDFGGPGMFGHHVHEAVLASGRTESGCTVHFCDNEYDHGPIILQRKVPVYPTDTPDTLAARVFEQECIGYPEAIRHIATERLRANGPPEL